MPYRKVKPHTRELPARNQMLYQMRIDNPNMTFDDLGKAFHISRSRAFRIFKVEEKRRLKLLVSEKILVPSNI